MGYFSPEIKTTEIALKLSEALGSSQTYVARPIVVEAWDASSIESIAFTKFMRNSGASEKDCLDLFSSLSDCVNPYIVATPVYDIDKKTFKIIWFATSGINFKSRFCDTLEAQDRTVIMDAVIHYVEAKAKVYPNG